MDQKTKRKADSSPSDVRRGNQLWWQSNPMTYDWRGERQAEPLSPQWFAAADAEFLAAMPQLTVERPFDKLIPYEQLTGKRVLEIGCGMGLHSQLLAQAGARVTSIDLTTYATQATRRRLAASGYEPSVSRMDGECLALPSGAFDLVWSWGVIHHAPSTAAIVREIARVLSPSGECRIMVYYREGVPALLELARGLATLAYPRRTLDELLWRRTDGFHARYYSVDQFEDLFRPYFDRVESIVTGQLADAVPLPRTLRRIVAPFVPGPARAALLSRFGGFLVTTARLPRK